MEDEEKESTPTWKILAVIGIALVVAIFVIVWGIPWLYQTVIGG